MHNFYCSVMFFEDFNDSAQPFKNAPIPCCRPGLFHCFHSPLDFLCLSLLSFVGYWYWVCCWDPKSFEYSVSNRVCRYLLITGGKPILEDEILFQFRVWGWGVQILTGRGLWYVMHGNLRSTKFGRLLELFEMPELLPTEKVSWNANMGERKVPQDCSSWLQFGLQLFFVMNKEMIFHSLIGLLWWISNSIQLLATCVILEWLHL